MFKIRVQLYHADGAVFHTQTASDTSFGINADNTFISSCYGPGRADIHAIGIFTLIADHRNVIKIFFPGPDGQSGPSWIVSACQIHAAGKLAEAASGTLVKVGMNKRFYNVLLINLL